MSLPDTLPCPGELAVANPGINGAPPSQSSRGVPAWARMRRYRARKIFERAVLRALACGVEQGELEDLVGFVASGVKMRFHPRPGRPSNVTPGRYIGFRDFEPPQ